MIRLKRPETPPSTEEILAQYPELEGVSNPEIQVAANKRLESTLKHLLNVGEKPELLESFKEEGKGLLYGKKASKETKVEVNDRDFGVEIYEPKEWANKKIWVVAMHGYAGQARDFSRLAEMVNGKNWGLLSFDMHTDGKDVFERMSMNINEWADVGLTAPKILGEQGFEYDKLIFVGQSSGGSAGAEICIRNEKKKVYDGAVLVSPTLTTVISEAEVLAIDLLMKKYLKKTKDVIALFRWLATAYDQVSNETLNKLHQGSLMTQVGMPLISARECYRISDKLLDALHKINIKTIMIRGEEDKADTKSLKAAQKVLKGNDLVEIINDVEGASHQMHIGHPEKVLEQIEKLV